jgi:hypothetical protein
LVDDGIIGLAVLLAAFTMLSRQGGHTTEGALVLLVIGILAGTESILEMQQPLFFACFFSMLPWGLKNVAGKRSEKMRK